MDNRGGRWVWIDSWDSAGSSLKVKSKRPIQQSIGARTMGEYLYCSKHPREIVSNGLFDAPCGVCEGEEEESYQEWQYDSANPERPFCRKEAYLPMFPWMRGATCLDVEDPIPF